MLCSHLTRVFSLSAAYSEPLLFVQYVLLDKILHRRSTITPLVFWVGWGSIFFCLTVLIQIFFLILPFFLNVCVVLGNLFTVNYHPRSFTWFLLWTKLAACRSLPQELKGFSESLFDVLWVAWPRMYATLEAKWHSPPHDLPGYSNYRPTFNTLALKHRAKRLTEFTARIHLKS